MLPLDPPSSPSPGANGSASVEPWGYEATPSVGLALRAEALVLSSCRLWCPPRPWSLLRSGGSGGSGDGTRRGGDFLHRVSAHALACPANHVSGARLLAALLPSESPAPLHRLALPVATAAAAAAGVAAAAAADAGGGGGGGAEGASGGAASLGRLVGRVHTAAALERSEGLRRQAVAALEHRVGEVLKGWDLCVAGDLFEGKRRKGGGAGGVAADGEVGGDEDGGGKEEDKEGGDDGGEALDGGGDGEERAGGWRPALSANPVLAVTAPEVLNVPAVVVSLCHSASPVLQRRVLQLARRYERYSRGVCGVGLRSVCWESRVRAKARSDQGCMGMRV